MTAMYSVDFSKCLPENLFLKVNKRGQIGIALQDSTCFMSFPFYSKSFTDIGLVTRVKTTLWKSEVM